MTKNANETNRDSPRIKVGFFGGDWLERAGNATFFQLPIVSGASILYYTLKVLCFSNLMDKTVLQSFRALPNCSNYAVGIFQDGELHVTPLKGVIQMRPQFNYLDKSDKRVREEAKNMGEGSVYVYTVRINC